MECAIVQTTEVELAKIVKWRSQQTRLSSRTAFRVAVSCVCVLANMLMAIKTAWLIYGQLNAALPLKSSIMWVDIMLLIPEFLRDWVRSCRFSNEISHQPLYNARKHCFRQTTYWPHVFDTSLYSEKRRGSCLCCMQCCDVLTCWRSERNILMRYLCTCIHSFGMCIRK